MAHTIDATLFPPPSHGKSTKNPLNPRTWSGVTHSSTQALQGILSDNHKRWHVFFNEKGFHNHTAHAALTLWCLGADESILTRSYEESKKEQRSAYSSPQSITKKNWIEHLGDENYYQAYMDFFKSELEQKDFKVEAVLEEYIFSAGANFVEGAAKQPEMLNRFFDGLLHPMIHTGLGLEFGLPGTFIEGIAQAAVHRGDSTNLLPRDMFAKSTVQGLTSRLAATLGLKDAQPAPAKDDVHAFTVLARVLADPTITPTTVPEQYGFYRKLIADRGAAVKKYSDQWTLEGNLQKKLEELIWTNVVIYAVGGAESSGDFNADFFHMHLVTSSIFLSSIFTHLERSSQVLLLRGYFSVCLGWYIGRGRPALDIARFFSNTETLLPSAPGPTPTPNEAAHPSPTSPHAITPNPWLQILQSTLTHPDDHLPKLQRALSEHASHFGQTPKGTFVGTELKDAELIDGTLFIRAAGLTASRLGWVREGQKPLEGLWDRRGFFSQAKL
ncbi:hypothetical protein CPC08DRAFT_711593 [Agrocybe pediades]|nr:hypothetical protein CPC08DRAFT_711593 [Agrocybe pediades]